ncbi:MAG TPA: DUF4870 domain-containing protein [Oscillatoriaceae cyanobacterium]
MSYIESPRATGGERLAAALAHASIFFFPIVLPAAIFFLYPLAFGSSPYVRSQTAQSFMFHLLVLIVSGVLGGMAAFLWHIILIGWLPAIACALAAGGLWLWAAIMEVVALLKVLQGERANLPIVGGW